MGQIIFWLLPAVALILTLLILSQGGGGGLSATFGGGESFENTKRGAEKTIWQTTVALIVVFVILAVLALIFPKTTKVSAPIVNNPAVAAPIEVEVKTSGDGGGLEIEVVPTES